MGLYERWHGSALGEDKIHVHTFASAIREWTRGAVTRQQIIDSFALTTEDTSELDAIMAHYNGMNSGAKTVFVVKLHDVMVLVEDELYTKAKAKAELGF